MLCILCNTAFMAIEHHGQSDKLTKVLEGGNYVSAIAYIHVHNHICRFISYAPYVSAHMSMHHVALGCAQGLYVVIYYHSL